MDNARRLDDLEGIVALDKDLVKNALQDFDETELVKAAYVVSPSVAEYFKSVYPEIDFAGMRQRLGSIPVNEAVEANANVLKQINASL